MTSDMGQLAQYMGSFEAEGTWAWGISLTRIPYVWLFLLWYVMVSHCSSVHPSSGGKTPPSAVEHVCHFACFNRCRRVEFTSKVLEECLRENWSAVKETAEKESPPFEYQGVLHDYPEEIDTLKLEVAALKKDVAVLKGMGETTPTPSKRQRFW